MLLIQQIRSAAQTSLAAIFSCEFSPADIQINDTKPEFTGEYTVVTFPFTKATGKKPEEIGQLLGEHLVNHHTWITDFNVIKGFLNLVIADDYYTHFLNHHFQISHVQAEPKHHKIMVEYSSPNTNKPLHFGHLRNIFLGASVSNIFEANGYEVIKANLINDRGIHICKSMIAWIRYGQGQEPETAQIKGDHLVGDYYVKYNDIYKEEVAQLVASGLTQEEAEKKAPILLEAQALLRKWEAHDAETIALWKKMNAWVYAGFDVTYKKLGITFDKFYYESDTYLLGKTMIEKGLQSGVLFQKTDQSVWIDLTGDGLDEKLLLRGDGTSVYITQDVGTADLKYRDFNMDQSIYVIGDEQNYHMQVLKLIMQKMKHPGAEGIHHLSYGMVELPTGRMKSREGTVVDADDMITEMKDLAQKNTEDLGKIDGFSQDELAQLYNTLGLGALKFYLLRVDPKKKMIFNPQESIDFHGFTGPFIQYTHARICSILRKAGDISYTENISPITSVEKQLLKLMEQYAEVLHQSAKEYSPAVICNYLFTLAKEYNSFLPNHPILKAEPLEKEMRLKLSTMVRNIIAHGLSLLGIGAPTRM